MRKWRYQVNGVGIEMDNMRRHTNMMDESDVKSLAISCRFIADKLRPYITGRPGVGTHEYDVIEALEFLDNTDPGEALKSGDTPEEWVEDFYGAMSAIYNWADLHRVWINPITMGG